MTALVHDRTGGITYKQTRWLVAFFVCIVGILITVRAFASHNEKHIQLGGRDITLEVAQSEAAKEQGLSGRRVLAPDHGMLFMFNKADNYCFWMKDMRFNLDLIWLDNADRVVSVEDNLSPDTYPQTFCPNNPAQYVIEVNAGVASAAHVSVGQELKIHASSVLF